MPANNKKTFRWELVAILIAIAVAAWLLDGVRVAFSWNDVLNWADIHNRARFTRLCLLGLWLIGLIAVIRVLRLNNKEE
jgi:hypothetical protein